MFDLLLEIEGGYVNDPKDPGGETKFGISKKSYPNLDIKNLTREQATAIYTRDYYLKFGIDRIKNIEIATALLVAVVHGGAGMYQYLKKEFETNDLIITLNSQLDSNKLKLSIIHRYIELGNVNKALKSYLFAWIERRIFYEW